MSRTFLDDSLLTWEVYVSGAEAGHHDRPYLVFNCLSNRMIRPRYLGPSEADAEGTIADASNEQLLALFKRSAEVS